MSDARLGFDFLFDDKFVVVAGVQSPWARRRKIVLAELMHQSWALPSPESAYGMVMMEAFRASGLDYPRATVVTSPAEMRVSLLVTGHFLTMVSTSVLRFPTKRPEIKVLPIDLPLAPMPIGIISLNNRTPSPVTQLFIKHAHEVAISLAGVK